MSKSSFYGIFFLVICLLVALVQSATAQTETVLIKSVKADTVDVTALEAAGNTVAIDTVDVNSSTTVRVVQSIEILNCKNKKILEKLTKVGFFNVEQQGSKQFVSLSDHSNKIISVGDNQLEIRRKYQITVPRGTVILSE